jgi:DNA-binding winged helix-turn-helix (wHTH) protein
MNSERFVFGRFLLDAARGSLTRDGEPVPVGSRGLAILAALLRAGNAAVAKADLVDAAWPGTAIEESNLSVQVAALRRLLGPMPGGGDWIATVARVGYRFDGPVDAAASGAGARPLVAVAGFAGDDGVADGIATALSRFRWFSVTRRDDPAARYRLQGSVRLAAGRRRFLVQLVDASNGANLWAEKYDSESIEPFAVEDEIARRVAGAIEPALLQTDTSRAASNGGRTAWDVVQHGTWLFHRVTEPTHLAAREEFRRACRLDPQLADARIWLARVSAGILAYGWSADAEADAREGLAAGMDAVRLDRANPYAHYGLAIVSIYAGEPEQALRAAERATELSDSFALAQLVLGLAHLAGGDAPAAILPLQRGLDLSPGDPQGFAWLNFLALAQLLSGDPAEGAITAGRLLQVRPDWRPGFETAICCDVALGRLSPARRKAAQAGRLAAVPGDALAPLRARPEWSALLSSLLRQAAEPA